MTLDDFTRLFPDSSFVLRHVRRGSDDRGFVWHAEFTSSYFTSDTDRLVEHETKWLQDAFGETPEAALDALIKLVEERLRGSLDNAIEQAQTDATAWADFNDRLATLRGRS